MHRLLRPKNINRLAVVLALFAPIMYLFGTQVATLAGAHGEELLAETTEVTPSYEELMTPENFSYGAFDWDNEHGYRLGFSLGYATVYRGDSGGDWFFNSVVYGVSSYFGSGNVDVGGFGFPQNHDFEDNDTYINLHFYYWVEDDGITVEVDESIYSYPVYTCFYVIGLGGYDPDSLYAVICDGSFFDVYSWDGSLWNHDDWNTNNIGYFGADCVIYYDDGANLPEGVEWNETLSSYFVPAVKSSESTSYRNALFGNMFGESNFLTDWGSDVLSETPHGFVPFATFFRFIDDNMLHLGSLNIGLMGYGYMYYVCHVLLFDVAIYCVTFFLRFIKSIIDKWEVAS